ncbi:DUF7474 family protein [Candidatus Halobonum tyrrellensis]|uniref:Uncharacterized protein n=1 Tax=Candidatus Halobonum tyrrellensis G22 TaxID=1324957 RepID=V4HBS5_9EURY|nr:hypothetical protein [Candidatus Halobonum tyrrellensis]ESP87498.1 hypothetical protein K933_13536 [Candidatus Halobonum tyrrellensis G22]
MPRFAYPCPGCRTTNSLHDADCEFEGTEWNSVEKAYTDLLVVLTDETVTEEALRHAVHDEWSGLHRAALDLLTREGRVRETDAGLELLTAEAYRESVSEPTREPMATIYREGSYPGCHDNALFAVVAWYEMVGLSWEETREHAVEWLRQSGAWDRGGFEEASPEALVDSKRHVYEAGYGWKEKAQAAKRVIDRHR